MGNIDRQSFPSAKENMRYDESRVGAGNIGWVRAYEWQRPGITYPKKRHVPTDLQHLDSSIRPTGGGIVFHAPGDVVLAMVIAKDDPAHPKRLKDKISIVTNWVQAGLARLSIKAHPKAHTDKEQNLDFCSSYFSPSELYVGTEKICGLTLKRFREVLLIQGIIHCQASEKHFAELPSYYHSYFTKGIPGSPDANDIITALEKTGF